MKRKLYIGLFMLLGFLLSLLVHATLEMPMLALIRDHYDAYGESYVWQHWSVIHGWGGKCLSLLGIFTGYIFGRRFWQILYIEKRYGTPRW